jgi:hypothetical protein
VRANLQQSASDFGVVVVPIFKQSRNVASNSLFRNTFRANDCFSIFYAELPDTLSRQLQPNQDFAEKTLKKYLIYASNLPGTVFE